MGRRQRHEEHTNHESWAIPYGDLITLLLAFFVVMYAISSVNEGKYRVLSDSIYTAFRGSPRTLEPVQTGEQEVGSGAQTSAPLMKGQTRSLLPPQTRAAPQPAVVPEEVRVRGKALTEASKALGHVADQLETAMKALVDKGAVNIHRNDLWIAVEIRSDILFPSGVAQLSPNAAGVIEELAGVLAPLPNSIRVEGHTDNVPIRTSVFYSNWELSAARAGSVVRMLAGHGVAPGRLAVVGLGEEHPIQTNDTAQGRNANRRVTVVILSTELTDNGSTLLGGPRERLAPDALPAAPAPATPPDNGTEHAT